jgi:ferric-dicitrate binding protein FerR (iron transport regulator)
MDRFIYDFFNKNFTKRTQRLFRWWFLNTREDEKEKSLQDLWKSEPSRASSETEKNFRKLSYRITEYEKSKHRIARGFAVAASIVVAAILGSLVTYSLVKNDYDEAVAEYELQQIVVPNGESRDITLSDGTHVLLGAGSTMIYPKRFSTGSRKVFLSGKAFFDVAEDAEHPFITNTKNMSVTALGTEFDVDAYSDSRTISSTLREGSIKVCIYEEGGHKDFIIEPDQQLLYDKETHKVFLRNVNADKTLSWTKGYQIFESASFSEILSTLETHYNVRIVCRDANKIQGSYNVKFFPNESVTDVLEILSNINRSFTYRQVDGIIYIDVK